MKDQPRKYLTAAAFRIALETRLKSIAKNEGTDLQRLRRRVSFDRLLSRFFAERNAPWLLKGGYAMELRLPTAGRTKDIDLSVPLNVAEKGKGQILETWHTSPAKNIGDFFTFTTRPPLTNLHP